MAMTPACPGWQAILSAALSIATLMPLGYFLTKACGGTCCGLFSCCGLTWLTWMALKALKFAVCLPIKLWCCVRRFERDRQVRIPLPLIDIPPRCLAGAPLGLWCCMRELS